MVLRRFVSLLPPFERIRDRSATGAAYIIEGHDPWMEVSDAENGCWGSDRGGRDEVHLGRGRRWRFGQDGAWPSRYDPVRFPLREILDAGLDRGGLSAEQSLRVRMGEVEDGV